MNGALCLRNRQRVRAVALRRLRPVIQELLFRLLKLEDFDLAVHLVNAREMARLNVLYLRHTGSTDVITLDYSGADGTGPLTGEIFVCVDEALLQARRFRTRWPAELLRYVIHGVLHLRGHDDLRPAARRRMKREEGRLLRELSRRFPLSKLERRLTLPP